MKNPNNYGSVYKLSGKRRKKYAVRLTVSIDENGKQKKKYVGYYATKAEATKALAEFNVNPINLTTANFSFKQVFDFVCEMEEKTLTEKNFKAYVNAFNKCKELHNMTFKDIRKANMQKIIDESTQSYSSTNMIKNLFGKMYKHAMENDIVNKNYAEFLTVKNKDVVNNDNKEMTPEFIKHIMLTDDNEIYDYVKILIFTGMRINELLKMPMESINLEESYFFNGSKSTAETGRYIPIAPIIKPIVEKIYYNTKGKTFSRFTYDNFIKQWKKQIDGYTPHNCRHTFISIADRCDMNRTSLKKLVGHSSKEITFRVYTHKDKDDLKKAILHFEKYFISEYLDK